MITRAAVVRGAETDPPAILLAEAVEPITLPPVRDGAAVVAARLSMPTPADSALVHTLLDELAAAGWADLVVGGAATDLDRDRGADVASLAQAAGYGGTTPAGHRYAVVDLRSALCPAETAPGSVLDGRPVSRVWAEAALRVVVGRNVTDAVDGFALCLSVLLGVAAPVPGAAPDEVVEALLAAYPPDLAVLDAVVSSHGPAGAGVLTPLRTSTVVAGTDAYLVDLAGAALQGVDPARSPLLRRADPPSLADVDGDLTPYAGWRSAAEAVAPAVPAASRLAQVLRAPAGEQDALVRSLRRALAGVGDDTGREAVLGWFTAAAGTWAQQSQAWSTVFAKDRVDRVETSLGFDPAAHAHADYDAIRGYLAPFDRLLADTPPGPDGLRWRRVDRAVVFEVSRVVSAPYEEFVARVDIAAGISLMADYLGGRVVPVSRDRHGRVTRQAERNVYLPQPNYLAFWGGLPIDVAKIECVAYGADHRRLSWRTVRSPNGSAEYDDGSLTFRAAGAGRTELTVRGRQLFRLPPFWQAVDLDRYPAIRDALTLDAYRRFFTGTFDNLEACFEGREFRIGRRPTDPEGPLPTAAVVSAVDLGREWLAERPLRERVSAVARRPRQPVGELDEDGFRHVRAADLAPESRPPGPLARLAAQLRAAYAADLTRLGGR